MQGVIFFSLIVSVCAQNNESPFSISEYSNGAGTEHLGFSSQGETGSLGNEQAQGSSLPWSAIPAPGAPPRTIGNPISAFATGNSAGPAIPAYLANLPGPGLPSGNGQVPSQFSSSVPFGNVPSPQSGSNPFNTGSFGNTQAQNNNPYIGSGNAYPSSNTAPSSFGIPSSGFPQYPGYGSIPGYLSSGTGGYPAGSYGGAPALGYPTGTNGGYPGGYGSFPGGYGSFPGGYGGYPGGYGGYPGGYGGNQQTSSQCKSCKDKGHELFCLKMASKCDASGIMGMAVKNSCKKTCGSCTPCSSSMLECTTDTSCSDKSSMCFLMANPTSCSLAGGLAKGMVLKNLCPVSCGNCKPCKKPVAPTEPTCTPDCKDKAEKCEYFANIKNYCVDSTYKPWMTQNCEKSCKLCFYCASPLDNLSEEAINCTDDCEDRHAKCSSYADSSKYCTSRRYGRWMTENCPQSCGICQKCPSAEVSQPATSTTSVPPTPRPLYGNREQTKSMPKGTTKTTAIISTTVQEGTTTLVVTTPVTKATASKSSLSERCVRLEDNSSSEREACLSAHNYYRCLHGASPLDYNQTLAESAKRYVAQMSAQRATKKSLRQSFSGELKSENVGENVGINLLPNRKYGVKEAITEWYAEGYLYNYDNPQPSDQTKHFTQLVWKDTTSVGCASKRRGDSVYVVAQYFTVGNDAQHYRTNVEFSDRECKETCQLGSCGSDKLSKDRPTCGCVGNERFAPVCTGRCVVKCKKPAYFTGRWLEVCEGRNLCSCNVQSDPDGKRYAGAWCQ